MSAFFYIAGVTVTVLGVLAIGLIIGVFISVIIFGNEIHLHRDDTAI